MNPEFKRSFESRNSRAVELKIRKERLAKLARNRWAK